MPRDAGYGGIGTPEQVRAHLRRYEQAGVDQIIFVQQSGNNKHEHICESLELFCGRCAAGIQGARGRQSSGEGARALAPIHRGRAGAQATELAPMAERGSFRRSRHSVATNRVPSFRPDREGIIAAPGVRSACGRKP